jgi:hypothetical protein
VKEGGVEHGDVRKIGKRFAGHLDAQQRGRIVQRRKRRQLVDLGDQCVVDECGLIQVRPTVHHPVPHRDQPRHIVCQLVEHHTQRRGMVGNAAVLDAFPDPFDDAVGDRVSRICLDDRIFQRRRTGVHYQNTTHSDCA